MVPAGRHGDRRRRPVPDPRHHRLPLAHRRSMAASTKAACRYPRWSTSRTCINPEDIAIYRALAGGVTTANILHGSANAIGGRTLPHQDALGQGRAGTDLRGRHAGHQVRAGRESQARRQSAGRARRRGDHRDRALSRHPHGRGGRHPRGVQRSQGLQGRVGRLRRQSGARRASHPAAQGSETGAAEGSARRQALRARALLPRRRDPDAAARGRRYGFKIRTLQHVLEGYKVAKEIAAHGAGASTFSDWWSYKVEAFDAIPYQRRAHGEEGRAGQPQQRRRRADAPPEHRSRQGHEVRRAERDRSARHGHASTRPSSWASTTASAPSKSARTPTW